MMVLVFGKGFEHVCPCLSYEIKAKNLASAFFLVARYSDPSDVLA